ncbi:hypothetical protein A8F94_01205 [Bacillus sp. FJAT-27225]|nr:hypothetical protein A8F94_01205 [Bacillus sp. FJAT-27225]
MDTQFPGDLFLKAINTLGSRNSWFFIRHSLITPYEGLSTNGLLRLILSYSKFLIQLSEKIGKAPNF